MGARTAGAHLHLADTHSVHSPCSGAVSAPVSSVTDRRYSSRRTSLLKRKCSFLFDAEHKRWIDAKFSVTETPAMNGGKATIQRNFRTTTCSSLLLLSTLGAAGQGTFQNLGFENTTLLVLVANPSGPLYITNATIPGWDWSPHFNAGYSDPNTTVTFNSIALDAAAVTLHGTDSFRPALSGNYSILLQGGSQFLPPEYPRGASVFQTGQIPVTAQSLIYLGTIGFEVSFNGQSLSRVALDSTATYTRWGIDISPYAGQSGELRFAVPGLGSGMLDGIQFSSSPIPEPSVLWHSILGLLLVAAFTRSRTRLDENANA